MSAIRFITLNQILYINKHFRKLSIKDKTIVYKNRIVATNIRDNLKTLTSCVEEFYSSTESVILTATYYLKNIIILQSLEDANHRTAIIIAMFFLNSNGYNIKATNRKIYMSFKNELFACRLNEEMTFDSLPTHVLKISDNTTENIVFDSCLKFIENEILR